MSDRAFRYAVGILAVMGGLFGLAALYAFEVPPGNKDPLLLALGVVLGWGASVVQSEFGSTSSGRNLAATNSAIVASAAVTPAGPTGKPGDPVAVKEEPTKDGE